MGNRFVPFIFGLAAFGIAVWLLFDFLGWWRHIVGAFLIALSWVSMKTAIFATDREIEELTTKTPMSKKTEERLRNRL